MEQGSPPPENSRLLVGGAAARASRALARERQKEEIRRERDQLLVAIARDIGADGFAQRLGTEADVTQTLLDSARRRLAEAEERSAASEIRAGRRRLPDGERWADADRHFERLGRGAPGPLRRFPRRD